MLIASGRQSIGGCGVGTANTMARRVGVLYPAMLIAAVMVTVFSLFGIATMAGWLPGGGSSQHAATGQAETRHSQPVPREAAAPVTRPEPLPDRASR
jgi:hypothetical protein